MQENILHDNEDDNTGAYESLNYYAHFGVDNIKEAQDTQKDDLGTDDASYHNSYYLGKGKYGSRTLRMSNKKWHKLNG